METNRIFAAPLGWLLASLIFVAPLLAQVIPPDSTSHPVAKVGSDSVGVNPQSPKSDSSTALPDTINPYFRPRTFTPESLTTETLQTEIAPTIYHERVYLAKGPADEIKGFPNIYIISPGPTGSPIIPVDYLNVSGIDVTLNGLPFPYQGLYRPYLIGTDLNTIPWEILNEIRWNQKSSMQEGLDFRVGAPANNSNRSDLDIARGPYSYEAARWRFMRPFGEKIYSYFTVGFKKSAGYVTNSDYNGFHVTGGASYKLRNGLISLDLWQHKANTGLNSFDFISPSQESRQLRVIDRGELRYSTSGKGRYFLSMTGFLHRTSQKVTGYGNNLKENYFAGGGEAVASDSTSDRVFDASLHFYRFILSKLGHFPTVSDFEPLVGIREDHSSLNYNLRVGYDWNKVDHGIILPSARLSFKMNSHLSPYIELLRARRLPDLNLLYFDDNVTGLGVGQVLRSYAFNGNSNLSMPVTNQASLGVNSDFGKIKTAAGVSLKKIVSQIYLSYSDDLHGNYIVAPTNFNDTFTELFARGTGEYGPFSTELTGAYRFWSKRYFPDGLEKGPAALGFARLSYLKEYFIPRLYLGGSLEARFSSRRDYRSLDEGFLSSFSSFSGRFEFRYKDLTIWLSDENLTNTAYTTWWPYFESPRIVWFGFLWNFIN